MAVVIGLGLGLEEGDLSIWEVGAEMGAEDGRGEWAWPRQYWLNKARQIGFECCGWLVFLDRKCWCEHEGRRRLLGDEERCPTFDHAMGG
jgi:hypothetical protein